jgi:DNA-binding CsgD family transcriptional regulator
LANLGAGLLDREVVALAQRGRLATEATVTSRPSEQDGASSRFGLTAREAEVLELIALGRTNREIADALFITVKTAGTHVSNILGKLGVAGRGEAAALAHRTGLITLAGERAAPVGEDPPR